MGFQKLVILPLHFPNVFTSSVAYYQLDGRPRTTCWHTDEWDAVTCDLWAAPPSSVRMCLARKLFWSIKKLLFVQITFMIMFTVFTYLWFFRKLLVTCVLQSPGYSLRECRNHWCTELRGRDTRVTWLYILDIRDLHRWLKLLGCCALRNSGFGLYLAVSIKQTVSLPGAQPTWLIQARYLTICQYVMLNVTQF